MEVREPSVKYLVPPGYKQTEVGVIPDDWSARELGEVASFRTGPFGSALHKSDYTANGVPVINPMHIVDGRIVPSQMMTITESAATKLSEFRLKPNEIVIGRRGDMGRCAVIRSKHLGWLCGTGSMIVRPSPGVNADFLQRVLSSPSVVSAIEDTSVGTTMINLNQGVLSSLVIQAPPLREQVAIADALSDADALIESLEQILVKKRGLKQAAMQELLTGKKRLPGFSEDWRRWPLRKIVRTPVTDGPHLTPRFLDDGIPFLSVNNLVDNKIDFSDLRYISAADHEIFSRKCRPQKGDVLLGKAASVGKVAIVETEMQFNIWSPIALIRLNDEHDPHFVYYQLQSTDVSKQIELLTNSSSQGNIGMGDIEKLALQLPIKQEQIAIATIFSDMDVEIFALEAKLAKARSLKQGMMQELLTGRIRLV